MNAIERAAGPHFELAHALAAAVASGLTLTPPATGVPYTELWCRCGAELCLAARPWWPDATADLVYLFLDRHPRDGLADAHPNE